MNRHTALALRLLLTTLTVAGLAIDAYIHFDLAANYDAIKTSTLSQGDLFRAESVVAIAAAVAVLVRPRRYTALIAVLVAVSALGALLLYRYQDIAAHGPIPSMYEPVWYPEKTLAAYAEAAASLAALGLFLTIRVHRGHAAGSGPEDEARQ